MTDRERLHRLHIENRLAELAAKHGDLPFDPLPAWLDHYPETPAEWADLHGEPPPAPPPPITPRPLAPATRPTPPRAWDLDLGRWA